MNLGTAKVEGIGVIAVAITMSDTNVDIVGVENVGAMRGTVHPPVEGALGSIGYPHIDILTPPGWVIAMGSHTDINIRAVGSAVRNKFITGHIVTMGTSGTAQAAVHGKGG